MKKQVKIIGGIVLGVVVITGVAAMLLTPLSLEAVILESTTARVAFTEQGNYQYDRSLAVYPQIAGEVLEVKVSSGQSVKKGDTLAVISASDYEHQIRSLESDISGYNAQIANLQTQEQENKSALKANRESLQSQLSEVELGLENYESTQKSLDRQIEIQEDIVALNSSLVRYAKDDLRQAREDYDSGYIDLTQYNAVRSAYNVAEATLGVSRQQLEQMQAGTVTKETYEAQRASLQEQLKLVDERMGRDTVYAMSQYYSALIESTEQNIANMTEKLGQAVITAPMDGVISDLPVLDANLVSQQSLIATIGSSPAVEVFVPVREIDGVKTGDRVELVVSKRLGDETIDGTVISVENEAQIRVSALGVEERKVRVLVKPQSDDLRIGFNMDVIFTVLEQPDCVIVPKTAVFNKDGGDMVWVIENGAVRMRAIEKGVETRDGYAVSAGLSAGETVVTDANIEGIAEGKRAKAKAS